MLLPGDEYDSADDCGSIHFGDDLFPVALLHALKVELLAREYL
jgi:hypothetical protein